MFKYSNYIDCLSTFDVSIYDQHGSYPPNLNKKKNTTQTNVCNI